MAAKATVQADGGHSSAIDRRTVKPALLVLGLAVLMSIVLPRINSETRYRDGVHRGDVVELADGITLVPTPGWDLASGSLVGHTRSPVGSTATTELVDGGVDFYVQAAPFDGTPAALLSRVNQINAELSRAGGRASATTRRYAVTTRQGAVGKAEDFVGLTRQGSIVAFVFRPGTSSAAVQGQPTREGVEVIVSGPKVSISRRRADIVAMIRSIRNAP